jgi:hypothetical protein
MPDWLFPLASVIGFWVVQVGAFVWWAASITGKVGHIEKWIAANEQTQSRLVEMETQMHALMDAVQRIEAHIMRGPGGR